jgi:hypothetical protein
MATQANVSLRPAATAPASDYVLLRRTLLANTLFSGATGVVLTLFSNPIEALMGGHTPQVLMLIGIGLIGFSVLTFTTAREVPMNRTKGWLVFYLDVAWVVASAIALMTNLFDLNTTGNVITLVAALGVADFAFFEWLGLRRGQR